MIKKVYFENPQDGAPERARQLRQFDSLLKRRRQECLRIKEDFIGGFLKSAANHRRNAERYRQELRRLFGWPLVDTELPPALEPTIHYCGQHRGIGVSRVRIPGLGPLDCYGILLLPPTPGPYRYVISQHGGLGTPEMTADFFGSANYNDMSLRLAQAGYAVFAPQLFLSWKQPHGPHRSQSEMDRDLRQVGASLAAVHVFLLQRAIDWIIGRPDSAEDSVGFVGLSYGGFYALATAACDTRIASVVSSCFFNDRFRYNYHDLTWFGSATKFMDAELCALVAPRPLYIEIAQDDEVFSSDTGRKNLDAVRNLYRELNVRNRFQFHEFSGRHEFNPGPEPLAFLHRHYPANASKSYLKKQLLQS